MTNSPVVVTATWYHFSCDHPVDPSHGISSTESEEQVRPSSNNKMIWCYIYIDQGATRSPYIPSPRNIISYRAMAVDQVQSHLRRDEASGWYLWRGSEGDQGRGGGS